MSLLTAVDFVNSLFTPRSASFIFLSSPCQEDVPSRKGARKEAKQRDRARTELPSSCPRCADSGEKKSGKPLPLGYRDELSYTVLSDVRFYFSLHRIPVHKKRRCEITIISFSRSICRGGLAALIGVTGKPYPSCLSYHSHPIRPFGAPSPGGEGY